jgi:hypothetical protein
MGRLLHWAAFFMPPVAVVEPAQVSWFLVVIGAAALVLMVALVVAVVAQTLERFRPVALALPD